MNTLRAGSAFAALAILIIARANAAILTGDLSPLTPNTQINLTTQGNTDWIHWGLNNANDVNRKATGLSQISNFTKIGSGTNVVRLTDSSSKYSWTDGSPTNVVTSTPGGVYINNYDGPGRGFQFSVPANLLLHTLFVYLGEFSATGTLTASLNDGSGLTYVQAFNGVANQTVQGLYKIDFQANTPASLLTVKWVETAELGTPATNADNITLQAVALCTPVQVPEPAAFLLLACGTILLARRR